MIPGKFSLTGDRAIYQGDTYVKIAQITLPDLSEFDGPADLTGDVTVAAQVRGEAQELLGAFDVEIIDEALRIVRPTMSPEVSARLPLTGEAQRAYWDLQVTSGAGDWVGTVLRGPVTVARQETQ